jgi:hypothetical protein
MTWVSDLSSWYQLGVFTCFVSIGHLSSWDVTNLVDLMLDGRLYSGSWAAGYGPSVCVDLSEFAALFTWRADNGIPFGTHYWISSSERD